MLVSAIGKFNAVKILNNTVNQNTFNGDKNALDKCRPHYDIKVMADRTADKQTNSQQKSFSVIV